MRLMFEMIIHLVRDQCFPFYKRPTCAALGCRHTLSERRIDNRQKRNVGGCVGYERVLREDSWDLQACCNGLKVTSIDGDVSSRIDRSHSTKIVLVASADPGSGRTGPRWVTTGVLSTGLLAWISMSGGRRPFRRICFLMALSPVTLWGRAGHDGYVEVGDAQVLLERKMKYLLLIAANQEFNARGCQDWGLYTSPEQFLVRAIIFTEWSSRMNDVACATISPCTRELL